MHSGACRDGKGQMQLKPGARSKSSVCNGQVIVVRPLAQQVAWARGGAPMVDVSQTAAAASLLTAAESGAALIGKRDVDEATGLELLCSKASKGALSVDGRPRNLKEAK